MTLENEELLRAYHIAFSTPAGQAVLTDLSPFCRAAESCVVPGDQYATAVAEGRREVWLRIQRFAQLNEEEILQLRLGRINPKPGE